jgi:RNA polymerase sigma-70 factor (sigma-E family)
VTSIRGIILGIGTGERCAWEKWLDRRAEAEREFLTFFQRYHAELSRFAYLMTGEPEAADDLAADALTEVWRHWDRVNAADSSIAYARGVLANLVRNRIRRLDRERRGLARMAAAWRDRESARQGDVPTVLDVREALRQLSYSRRACVVLRHGFGLSERETAAFLNISVGTVKSQTSRGAAQLVRLLGETPLNEPARRGNGGSGLTR